MFLHGSFSCVAVFELNERRVYVLQLNWNTCWLITVKHIFWHMECI